MPLTNKDKATDADNERNQRWCWLQSAAMNCSKQQYHNDPTILERGSLLVLAIGTSSYRIGNILSWQWPELNSSLSFPSLSGI